MAHHDRVIVTSVPPGHTPTRKGAPPGRLCLKNARVASEASLEASHEERP
jgi:hypothetical protein